MDEQQLDSLNKQETAFVIGSLNFKAKFYIPLLFGTCSRLKYYHGNVTSRKCNAQTVK